jgi:hypothetical protein
VREDHHNTQSESIPIPIPTPTPTGAVYIPTSTLRMMAMTLLSIFFMALCCSWSRVEAADDQLFSAQSVTLHDEQHLQAFERLRKNLLNMTEEIRQRSDLFGPRPANDPTLLSPDMRRQINSLWYVLLDHYLALGVAERMSRIKVLRPHRYLIQSEQIENLSHHLQPGDILLQRREWYLTNVGIPGFWTHAALFIGSPTQRNAFSQYPEVKDWLEQMGADSMDNLIQQRYPDAYCGMQTPYHRDGRLPEVLEALSPGVILTSLHYSATCDSLAVLRPRLPPADRAAAVVRAMQYHGRPYDYTFDFMNDERLVCTEVIVKSYFPEAHRPGLDLPLENIMGHLLTPANAFAQHFDISYGSDGQQMDLVFFLDGQEKEKLAIVSGVEAFRQTWKRPKWHILIQSAQGDHQ